MKTILERARNYIATIHSISGSGGHTSALAAATALVRGYDLPEDSAMELLSEWNQTNALPPWGDADLRHKLREAAKSDRSAGYLLTNDKSSAFALPKSDSRSLNAPAVSEDATKAAKRHKWPTFRLGTEAELRAVAKLRHLHGGIPWLAQREGLLRFTTTKAGEQCFVLTEGTLAQARRMDGKSFDINGSICKSWSLPGSDGKWMGYTMLESHPKAPVLIVEGLVAWMEAAHAITASDHLPWLPFAALAAGVKLESRELALLAGRRVLIARDLGEAGVEAALNWEESLQEIGVQVSIWEPPLGAKDLGDALRLPSFNANSIFNHS